MELRKLKIQVQHLEDRVTELEKLVGQNRVLVTRCVMVVELLIQMKIISEEQIKDIMKKVSAIQTNPAVQRTVQGTVQGAIDFAKRRG